MKMIDDVKSLWNASKYEICVSGVCAAIAGGFGNLITSGDPGLIYPGSIISAIFAVFSSKYLIDAHREYMKKNVNVVHFRTPTVGDY